MTAVALRHVKKQFPNMSYPALDDISVEVEEGEFITILGSSGCGKTTLIKTINRLYEPDEGEIYLFGENALEQDPVVLRRCIGYVIQQVGLFPHMTVRENIATIPRLLKWDKERTLEQVDAMLTLVDLDPAEFRERYPAQLSGGQQQRVGLARALIADPRIMLLDEPFGAIDAITRENLQNELLRIHRESDTTYLFVTHDIREAFKLGTRVMVMNRGRICQFDTPAAIVANPADAFVQNLIESSGPLNDVWRTGEGI